MIVAWSGESLTRPARLGWWRTQLADPDGGMDLFKRIAPRTWEWAVFSALRSAAREVDRKLFEGLGNEHQNRTTLFHWGFALDERLDERLNDLRRAGGSPWEVLPGIGWLREWSAPAFTEWVQKTGSVDFVVEPTGRRIPGPPRSVEEARIRLVAALHPLSDRYPAPHFRQILDEAR